MSLYIPVTLYALAALLLANVGAGIGDNGGNNLRTININRAFGRWNRTNIPYYIDPAFSATEQNMIKQAITTITTNLNYCVYFNEVPSTSPLFKIKFSPLTGRAGSPPQTYCYSYPGASVDIQQSSSEQIVSLARGPTGCMTSHCTIQKYLAVALGKRNEHQRGDRDSFIKINPVLQVPSAYQKYATTEAFWSLYPYDYCSITHNQPTEFAMPGTHAFTLPATASVSAIPQLCQLSLTDCKLLSSMYGCDIGACKQPACALQVEQSTATTQASCTCSTTPASALTAQPCPDFCLPTTVIDDGALLLDRRQVVFSGTCYAEIDSITNKVKSGSTQQISTLFPGGVITGPVQTTGVQYACTTTVCAAETPARPIATTETVFEDIVAGGYKVYTIDGTGANYVQDGASSLAVSSVICPTIVTCTGALVTWTAAWSTGADNTVNVIGKDAAGTTKLQQMFIIFPGFMDSFQYTADSAAFC